MRDSDGQIGAEIPPGCSVIRSPHCPRPRFERSAIRDFVPLLVERARHVHTCPSPRKQQPCRHDSPAATGRLLKAFASCRRVSVRGWLSNGSTIQKPHDYDAAADYLSMLAEDAPSRPDGECAQGREPGVPQAEGHPARGASAAAAAGPILTSRRTSPRSAMARSCRRSCWCAAMPSRGATADRRRIPPGVRELHHRREHRDPVPAGVVASDRA